MFFCFKQKTAYERRISDWSSDVCSSDLAGDQQQRQRRDAPAPHPAKRACQSPSENPTLTPSAASTTGRRIIAGWSSISALALAASRSALSVSASLRKVVPLLLRSEEHTSELQSLMRISYAVFCLKKKKTQ